MSDMSNVTHPTLPRNDRLGEVDHKDGWEDSILFDSADSLEADAVTYNATGTFNMFDLTTTVNNSARGTNSTDVFEEPLAFRLAAILLPIFFGIIILVGIVGNSLVITVMTKMYRHHGQGLSNTNRFILNLAVSDLFFLIFCVPFHATVYTLPGWPFGAFMCVFTRVCQELTTIASVYTLVALSVDRFLAVVYATSARQIRTRANANRGMIFIWIASIGIATPTMFTRVYLEYQGLKLCIPSPIAWRRWYELNLFLLGYVLPLLVIIGCYMGLLLAMCRNARRNLVTRNKSTSDARKRVARIVILVVIVFAICWFPHHFFILWVNFGVFEFNNATLWLRLIAHCMSYANSCINPLIYGFVSKKFRNDFKKAFTCQYLSDAVFNVKAFSQRMLVGIGSTVREVRPSLRRRGGDGAEDTGNPMRPGTSGGVARVIRNKNAAFCPRSPVMVYSPNRKEETNLLETEDACQRTPNGSVENIGNGAELLTPPTESMIYDDKIDGHSTVTF